MLPSVGCPPRPRLRVNPRLAETIYEKRLLKWRLAYAAKLNHGSQLSRLLHESIADTPSNRAALERVADVVGFPQSELFLNVKDAQ